MSVTLEEFEQFINQAIAQVPANIQAAIKNVAFVIDDERLGNQSGYLLGLYHGVPLTRRGQNYSGVLPDKITIYKKTIEQIAGDNLAVVKKQTIATVHHEIAHYFGFNEAEVRRWEKKRK